MARVWSGAMVGISSAIWRPRAISRFWSAAIGMFIADRHRGSRLRSARKARSLLITRLSRLPAGMRRPFELSLAVPMIRDLET